MENFMFCAVSELNIVSKKPQNADLIFYNVNLMRDVFKIIVKYRRTIYLLEGNEIENYIVPTILK